MWTHINVATDPGADVDRSHMVEEDEGPDHAPLCERQDAADFQSAAEAPSPLFDDHFDHGFVSLSTWFQRSSRLKNLDPHLPGSAITVWRASPRPADHGCSDWPDGSVAS